MKKKPKKNKPCNYIDSCPPYYRKKQQAKEARNQREQQVTENMIYNDIMGMW